MNTRLRTKELASAQIGSASANSASSAATASEKVAHSGNIPFVDNVWPHLSAWQSAGERVVLVTLINIDGASPRRLGANMAVAETGGAVGYITGGCLESAIALEARDVLASGTNRIVRYGVGSPYFDIRLPCNGGIDVHYDIGVMPDTVAAVRARQTARQPFVFRTDLATGHHTVDDAPAAICDDNGEISSRKTDASTFQRLHLPTLRVCIGGHGATAEALKAVAATQHWETCVMSAARGAVMPNDFDRWTAVASVHHDHDVEIPLLEAALMSDAFYVGAIGSRQVVEARRQTLAAAGFSANELARLRSPVGLIAQTKSPTEMALSITSEIADVALRVGRLA